jgi:hypothetical protein
MSRGSDWPVSISGLCPEIPSLREINPKAAHAALRRMIEATAASLPAHKQRKFLEELVEFLNSKCRQLIDYGLTSQVGRSGVVQLHMPG